MQVQPERLLSPGGYDSAAVDFSLIELQSSFVSPSIQDIQWGEQVLDTLPVLKVFPLTKHVEVCHFCRSLKPLMSYYGVKINKTH